jgi:hypothetical protein
MKRLIVIAITLLTFTAMSAMTATASFASVCQPNGKGCTAAGTYRGPNAVINSNYGSSFKVIWTKSVVRPYSTGVPLYWTAYVTYTNTSSSSLDLVCPPSGPPTISENMSGGSGNDGKVYAETSNCTGHPGRTVTVPPGGSYMDWGTFHNVPWPGSAVSITWGDVGSSPSVYPFGSARNCRIDVRGTGIAFGFWPSNFIADHLWVVYTDMTGTRYHYEDLPDPYPWRGPINQGYNKTYRGTGALSKTIRSPIPVIDGPVTARSGVRACGKDSNGNPTPGFGKTITQGPPACFLRHMAKIDKAKDPYDWLTTNSNAFVHTILLDCGIKRVKPNVNTPGWGKLLKEK